MLELVEEAGHVALTIAQVAERSGTAVATVLYHFPTKDHLLVHAVRVADEIALAAAGLESDTAVIDPAAMLVIATSGVMADEHRLRLFEALKGSSADPGHPAAAYFAHRQEQALAIFTRLIVHRQQQGMAHPDFDPELVALQIHALFEGLTGMWMHDRTLDVGRAMAEGVRRLSGENWMMAMRSI